MEVGLSKSKEGNHAGDLIQKRLSSDQKQMMECCFSMLFVTASAIASGFASEGTNVHHEEEKE
jgi:hypothetical protein